MSVATSKNWLLVLWDAPNRILSTNSRSSGQPRNDANTLFSTLHHFSPVIVATAAVVAFVLLGNSRLNFICYTQREPTPTQKSARKWQLRPFATSCAKDYEGHSLVQTSITEPPNNGESDWSVIRVTSIAIVLDVAQLGWLNERGSMWNDELVLKRRRMK